MNEPDPYGRPPGTSGGFSRYLFWALGLLLAGAALAFGVRWYLKPNVQASLGAAQTALEAHDYTKASIHLKTLLASDPYHGEARYLLGRTFFETWDLVAANVELRNAQREGYRPELVLPLLTRTLVEMGRPAKELVELDVSRLNDQQARGTLFAYRARALASQGMVTEGQAALAEARRLAPGAGATRVSEALELMRENKLPDAQKIVRELVAAEPNNFEAWMLIYTLAYGNQQREAARDALEHAAKAAPGLPGPRSALGRMLVEEQKYAEARTHAAMLTKMPRGQFDAIMLNAHIAWGERRFEVVRSETAKVLKVAPDYRPALLMGAAAEAELGAWAAADALLRKVLATSKGDNLVRRQLAELLIRQEKLGEAQEVLQPALAVEPVDTETLTLAGRLALLSGDAKRALELLSPAAERKPADAAIASGIAAGRIMTGDESAGIAILERLGSQHRDQYETDLMVATAHLRGQRPAAALAALDRLEAKHPNNPLAYNLRGVVHMMSQQYPQAREALERALKVNQNFVPAALNLAQIDAKEGHMPAAIARLETMVARQPRSAEALSALAELKFAQAAPRAEVTALLEKAQAANPKLLSPRIKLIHWHLSGNEPRKAAALALATLTDFPQSAEALALLGNAQMANGEGEQALSTYKRLASEHRKSAAAHLELARAQLTLKDTLGARSSLDAARFLDPENREVQLAMIQAEGIAGAGRKALSLAQAFQRANPNSPDGFVAEGDVQLAAKNTTDALVAYRKAMALAKSTPTAIKIHRALVDSGQAAEAEKFAKGWLQQQGQDAPFRHYLAYRHLLAGDFKAARAGFEQVVEQDSSNAGLLNNLAWACFKDGDLACAGKHAEAAQRLSPNDPSVLDTLGLVRLQQGDGKKAQELLARATSVAPTRMDILWHYASALAKNGRTEQAKQVLGELLNSSLPFDERDQAKKLLASL